MNVNDSAQVERKTLLREVCQWILRGKYYSILGPKLIGKTTFLKQIKSRIEKEHGTFRCVYIDLGDLKTADSRLFYSDFVHKIAGELYIHRPEQGETNEDFDNFLTSLLNSTNNHYILILDEIEHLPEYIIMELLELFRSYHQARQRERIYEKLSVVVSGSTNLLEFTLEKPTSPFNIAHPVLLSDLDADAGRELIDTIMSRNHSTIEQNAVQKILEETNGHPYLVPKICRLCVEKADAGPVTEKIVDESINLFIRDHQDDELISFIIHKVEDDLDIFETLIEIFAKGHSRQKEAVLTIGKHELSGAFSKEGNLFKIRNRVIKKFLDAYFDNVRKGDVFILHGKWEQALELYKSEHPYVRISRRRYKQTSSTWRRTIDIINPIGKLMYSPTQDTEKIFQYLLNGIHYALSYDSVYLYSVDEEKSRLKLKDFRGAEMSETEIEIEDYSRVLEVRAFNAETYIVEDKNEQNNLAAAYPLQLKEGSVQWILSINNHTSRVPIKKTECEDLNIFANEALLAIRNARSYYHLYEDKKAILEAVGEELSIIDKEYNILYMNQEKINRIGGNYSEIGAKCHKVFDQREEPCEICPCREAMSRGKIVTHNYYRTEFHVDGKEHFVFQTASPLKDMDGKCSRAVKVVRDVTKQKKLFDIIEKMQKVLNFNKLIKLIMNGIVELGYKRARFYDYVEKEKEKFVIGRISIGMGDFESRFRGYRIDLEAIEYLNATTKKRKPKFYFGDRNETLLMGKKWLDDLELENVKWMDLPLISGNKLIGFIGIDNKTKGEELTDEDLNMMAILAGYAAQAIENSRNTRRRQILYEISKKVSETLQIEKLQEDIVKNICKVLHTEMCSIFLFDAKENRLIRKSVYLNSKDCGWSHNVHFEEDYVPGTFICGRVYSEGKRKIIDDIQGYKGDKNTGVIDKYEKILKSGQLKNAIFAPVTYKGDKIGIIRASNKLDENNELSKIGFKTEELDLLASLGAQIAAALANSKLYKEKDLQFKGIEALNHIISMITSAVDLEEIYKAVEKTKNVFPGIDEMCLSIKKGNNFLHVFKCPSINNDGCDYCRKFEIKSIKKDEGYDVYYCPDVEEDPYFKGAIAKDLKSRFIIPLVFKKELLGIFDIGSKTANAFSEFDQRIFRSLGSQIAIAINNRIKQDQQKEIFKNITHSLGTYLTTIKGYTQLFIAGKVEEDKIQEYFKDLMGDVEACTNFVDEISSLTKMEYGDMTLSKERVDIIDIIRSRAQKNEFLLNEKKLKLTIQDTDESIFVNADKKKLEEAFQSLMNNAIKFSGENKTITITVHHDADHVRVDINDQGIGIHEDEKEKIFIKYVRGKNAIAGRIEGTGIGLAIAKNIIEMHSGEISVQSQPNMGSTFTIKLPIIKEEVLT
jgi:signal transduction histidine kinase/PAS domain-containing protein